MKKFIQSGLVGIALAGAVLTPTNAGALDVSVIQDNSEIFEGFSNEYQLNVSGRVNPTSSTLEATWDWDDGTTTQGSGVDYMNPAHEWQVDDATTKNVNVTVREILNGSEIASASTSIDTIVYNTPIDTTRRFTESDFDRVIYVPAGLDTLTNALQAEEGTSDNLGVFLQPGTFTTFNDINLFNRSNLTIVGPKIIRGNGSFINDSNFVPYDSTGSTESSVFQFPVSFSGDNVEVYDVILNMRGSAPGLINFEGNYFSGEGIYADRSGNFSLSVGANATTGTLNGNRLELLSGDGGIVVHDGNHPEKPGVSINNNYIGNVDSNGNFVDNSAKYGLRDAKSLQTESVAIYSLTPMGGVGNVVNVPIIQRTLLEGDYKQRYLDAGRSLDDVAASIVIENAGSSGAKSTDYSPLGVKGYTTSSGFNETPIYVQEGNTRINLFGLKTPDNNTAVGDWSEY